MLTKTQLRVIEHILQHGPWGSEAELMSEVLQVYPGAVRHLHKKDADAVIEYGYEVLKGGGLEPPPYDREDDTPEGKCVDLWEDDRPKELHAAIDVGTLPEFITPDEPENEPGFIGSGTVTGRITTASTGDRYLNTGTHAGKMVIFDEISDEWHEVDPPKLRDMSWTTQTVSFSHSDLDDDPDEPDMMEEYEAFKKQYQEREEQHKKDMAAKQAELDQLIDEVNKLVVPEGIKSVGRAAKRFTTFWKGRDENG